LRDEGVQAEHCGGVVEVGQLRAHLEKVFAVRHDVVDVVVIYDGQYLRLQPGLRIGIVQAYTSGTKVIFYQTWSHPLRVTERHIRVLVHLRQRDVQAKQHARLSKH
jgi:hypothetical protein